MADIERAVIGIRSRIEAGVRISESLVLGADFYESLDATQKDRARGVPPIGIGEASSLERAIVDKNARIGKGVRIKGDPDAPDRDGDGYFVRDGIVIIPKNGVVPDGAII